jgi:glycosyltransferase involved in cell wall biosynthesis
MTTAKENQVFKPEGSHLLILDLFFNLDHAEYIIELAKNKKVELTFFSCDLIPINHQEYCSSDLTFYFRKFLEISKYSGKLWCISKTTKREIDEYVGTSPYLANSTFKWLPPSLYGDCLHKLPFVQAEEPPYLLFVSSFEPRKNHVGFFKAVRNLREMGVDVPRIILVGGNAWDDDPITQGILDLRSEGFDLVKLTNIDECCVGKLYQHALLTLYPSFFEGFGLPVVESLSFGVPVLTSNIGSTGELLELPGTMGFFPGDSNDLAKQLNSFLTNESLRQKLKNDAISTRGAFGDWLEYASELYAYATKESDNLN